MTSKLLALQKADYFIIDVYCLSNMSKHAQHDWKNEQTKNYTVYMTNNSKISKKNVKA